MTKSSYLFWRGQFVKYPVLKYVAEFFGIYTALLFIALGIVLLINPHTRSVAIVALVAFVIAKFLVSDLLALVVDRPRPYQEYDFKPVIFSKLFSLKSNKARSFPSGHVISIVSISVVLLSYDLKLGLIGLGVAILTGISRVLLGFHYPTDVIAGFLLGILVGYLTLSIL